MTTEIWVGLIAGSAGILGGVIGAAGTLITQKRTLNAESDRWQRDAAERTATRFHADRLDAYADFLAVAGQTIWRELGKAIERQNAAFEAARPPSLAELLRMLSEPSVASEQVADLNDPTPMLYHHNLVLMLSGRQAVKDAADRVVDAAAAPGWFTLEADVAVWKAKAAELFAEFHGTRRVFTHEANIELNA